MGNTRNTGYLQNTIKVADNGNISLMHGSTMLMQISSSGAITTTGVISGSAPVLSAATASFVALAQSASNAISAQTASFANTLTVAGTLTAQTLVVQTITSSVDFVTGSTRFGQLLTNTHVFSGSVSMNPGGLFVSSSGNVGIGTTSPNVSGQAAGINVLTVKGSTSWGGVEVSNNSNTADGLLLGFYGFTNSGITGNSSAGMPAYIGSWLSGTTGADNGAEIRFYTKGNGGVTSQKMVIANSGNVGIGTITPPEPLSVSFAAHGLISQHRQSSGVGVGQNFYMKFNTANGTAANYAGIYAEIVSNTDAAQSGRMILQVANAGSLLSAVTITNSGDLSMAGTGATKLQAGTTAQRPTAAAGQLRYNTSLGEIEMNNGSNWGSLQSKVVLGSSPSNAAESANEIKTYYPNATNGFYWIKQTGSTAVSAYCVFKDFTGADIAGGPWTVPIISNDANSNFSTNGTTAASQFLSKCQAIGINTPGRGMESSRTTTEVFGAWLAVKRAIWEAYTPFVSNGNTGGGAVLRMPIININGEGGASDHRTVYNTSNGTHIPNNESGDRCNAAQLFCGWWAATDTTTWRTNNNDVPGPEDWGPSDTANTSYNGAGVNSVLTVCVYK